ncbi:MAG: undecaprenyl-diphosphatase [Thermoleophilaceae bacterium]|jgi:undecaprenyl-diphosphatase|nr:undecaprenyl-diphosphatase [Thermoleophilaceae bacterium]
MLPVSSSGHLALVPRLLGWDYSDLPADARKTFEVALHAGSAPAVALALRGQLGRDPHLLALTLLPPAAAGLLLERPIERRLGGLRSVALAQIVAGAALLIADGTPERRSRPNAADHLAVGLAQAAALIPGVSRSGAALTAARLRGLSRPAAASLSLRAALPVTVGAGVLKGVRAARDGVPEELRVAAAVGAGAACASALAALPLARGTRWREIAVYRIALGLGALCIRGRGSLA